LPVSPIVRRLVGSACALLLCGLFACGGAAPGEASDAGHDDAGAADASAPDAGSTDAGLHDAGGVDAGPFDAGNGLSSAYFDVGLAADPVFTRANPDPALVDLGALDALIAQAREQKSDSLLVALNDVIITETYFGKRPAVASVQSITKSVTSLAVGALLDDGKIASVDAPASTWFSDWGTGEKANVTLRMLLNMTSGLDDNDAFFAQSDLLAYARAQPLATAPGTQWAYSNEGAMLFAGILQAASGLGADALVEERYFAPMGITDAQWAADGAGNIQTPGGLYLSPRDLLRLGRLARDGGSWSGTRLVSSAWLGQSTVNQTSLEPCYGYLWWIVQDGCGDTSMTHSVSGSPKGFFADGWGGNYIAVIPSSHVIGIRTKALAGDATFAQEQATAYPAFTGNVAALVHP
jgi:CubicO group peptidase (beta-lactamase class C family)